jgi:hypothetical protein
MLTDGVRIPVLRLRRRRLCSSIAPFPTQQLSDHRQTSTLTPTIAIALDNPQPRQIARALPTLAERTFRCRVRGSRLSACIALSAAEPGRACDVP